jgi:hypothetical protein
MGMLALLVVLAQQAAARTTSKGETGNGSPPSRSASGVASSPACGLDWTVVASPNAFTNTNYLRAVAAVSSSDVWAVGYYESPGGSQANQTLTEHWDGTGWSIILSPSLSGGDNYLDGVAAVSSSDVWAVGLALLNSQPGQTLTEHWDGTTWRIVSSPNLGTGGSYLYSVAAISSGDVWAVGYYFLNSDPQSSRTLTEYWDGNSWRVVSSPNSGDDANTLFGVSAISSGDVWAVGSSYSPDFRSAQTLVEEWRGGVWNIVLSPDYGYNNNVLYAVAALSTNNVWAVGTFSDSTNTDRTLVEQWDGTTWNVVPSPSPGTQYSVLDGVAAVSSTDVWAVGDSSDSIETSRPLIAHWDGSSWQTVTNPRIGYSDYLFGVAAVSSSDVWTVGAISNGGKSSPYQTLVDRYNPCPTACSVRFEDLPNPSTFYAYVQCLACRGVISGYACGVVGEPCDPAHDPYFRPNANVTRGQIAKLMALSAQIYTPVSGRPFEDVPPGSPFYTYTEQLYALRVMSGYACGGTGEPCHAPADRPYFRPGSNATRGQLAKIDSNAAAFNDPPAGRSFQDVAAGSTFYTYTERLKSRGVMGGYACGGASEPCVPPANLPYFRPNANVTRGQTSKITANTFYPNCQTR